MKPTWTKLKKMNLFAILLLCCNQIIYAQQPTHSAGSKNDAIDLSNWFEIVVFIIFPIIIFAVYIAWRKKVSNEKKEKKKNTQND